MTRKKSAERTLRIIGGNWRSRKVSFPPIDGIRPSPDRVRETLFNWLQYDTPGARCIEPYAGSGILSIEALSRGASMVTALDVEGEACRALSETLTALGASRNGFDVQQSKATDFLARSAGEWDIAFLDPPFGSDELSQVLPLIDSCLGRHGIIYIESARAVDADMLPARFELQKSKRAGQVHYALCRAKI